MKQDEDCWVGFAIITAHRRLGHGPAFEELQRQAARDPDMGCDEMIERVSDLETIEQHDAAATYLEGPRGPTLADLRAEAALLRGEG